MTKLAELAELAQREADELEIVRAVLIDIVTAKQRGEPDPDAWDDALALVERWQAADDASAAPPTVRCPSCKAILSNAAAGDALMPKRVECGPVHVLDYGSHTAEIGDDGLPRAITAEPTQHVTVFAEESDGDAPV